MLEVEKKHSRRSARKFYRDTPSKIFASVYTQEKFTLKFYLINAIIEDKKIDVDFAPERILEKEKRRREIRAGGPIDKFDVIVFVPCSFFSYNEQPYCPSSRIYVFLFIKKLCVKIYLFYILFYIL